MAGPPNARYTSADRTPLYIGRRPVAMALHTGSACVGRSVARCSTAPWSKMRPMLGSRPAATAGEIMSRVAPSNISMVTLARARRASGSATAVVGRAGSSDCRAGPRAAIGMATDNTIVTDSSAGAQPSAAAAQVRQGNAEEHDTGRGHHAGANAHAAMGDRIEHATEAAQVQPHQGGAGGRPQSCTATTAASRSATRATTPRRRESAATRSGRRRAR